MAISFFPFLSEGGFKALDFDILSLTKITCYYVRLCLANEYRGTHYVHTNSKKAFSESITIQRKSLITFEEKIAVRRRIKNFKTILFFCTILGSL
jgi:hypothetical protein